MAASVQLGQIVWAELADANGIRKMRPADIVTPSQRITGTDPLDVVAITSRLSLPLPADHVLLPWHPNGHARTGLNRKCAAVCTWVAQINPNDIQAIAGIVPSSTLLDILSKIAAAASPPPPPDDSGEPPAQSPS